MSKPTVESRLRKSKQFESICPWVLQVDVSPAALKLYLLLLFLARGNDTVMPKVRTLSEELGCSMASVRDYLRELDREGLVERVPRFHEVTNAQLANDYVLWNDAVPPSPKAERAEIDEEQERLPEVEPPIEISTGGAIEISIGPLSESPHPNNEQNLTQSNTSDPKGSGDEVSSPGALDSSCDGVARGRGVEAGRNCPTASSGEPSVIRPERNEDRGAVLTGSPPSADSVGPMPENWPELRWWPEAPNWFEISERVHLLVADRLGWTVTNSQVRRELRIDSPLQELVALYGETGTVKLFLHAAETWKSAPTWGSLNAQHDKVAASLKASLVSKLNTASAEARYADRRQPQEGLDYVLRDVRGQVIPCKPGTHEPFDAAAWFRERGWQPVGRWAA